MSRIVGHIHRPRLGVCLDSVRTPTPLRETSGPTTLRMGDVPDGTLLAREGDQIVGVPAPSPDMDVTVHVDVSGDDDSPGTEGAPVRTLLEAVRRLDQAKERKEIVLGEGDFPLPDLSAEEYFGRRLSLGADRGYLIVRGTMRLAETFTVASVSGLTLTAAGSPGWTANEHVGRLMSYDGPLGVTWHPVLSNTADTITINYVSTAAGGYLPAHSPGALVHLHEPATRIVPSPNSPSDYRNRLFFHGLTHFTGIDFDGGGSTFAGPTSMGTDDAQFMGCWFRGFTGRGLELQGGNVAGCYFASCGTALSGRGQVNDCFADSCSFGYAAAFGETITLGAWSILAMRDVSQWCLNGKTDATINDETIGVYLDNCRDYVFLQRGSRFVKVNAPLTLAGGAGLNRHLVRMEEGMNFAQLYSTPDATVPAAGDYLSLEGEGVSLSDYSDSVYSVDDGSGNRVIR